MTHELARNCRSGFGDRARARARRAGARRHGADRAVAARGRGAGADAAARSRSALGGVTARFVQGRRVQRARRSKGAFADRQRRPARRRARTTAAARSAGGSGHRPRRWTRAASPPRSACRAFPVHLRLRRAPAEPLRQLSDAVRRRRAPTSSRCQRPGSCRRWPAAAGNTAVTARQRPRARRLATRRTSARRRPTDGRGC